MSARGNHKKSNTQSYETKNSTNFNLKFSREGITDNSLSPVKEAKKMSLNQVLHKSLGPDLVEKEEEDDQRGGNFATEGDNEEAPLFEGGIDDEESKESSSVSAPDSKSSIYNHCSIRPDIGKASETSFLFRCSGNYRFGRSPI